MGTSLAHRLRTETADLHRLAERSGIMHGLLRGRLDRGDYVDLLRSLHAVYDALERRLAECADHPVVQPFHQRALLRTAALVRDLTVLHGAGWEVDVPVTPAAQALGRVIARALALPDEEGVSFYRVPDIDDVDAFKDRYRAALDALPLGEGGADEVVREAQDTFRLNVRVFEAVGTRSAPFAAPAPPPAA